MCPSENEQQGGGEEEHNDGHNDILIKETDSWNNFEYALRDQNRLLFNEMLSECKENEDFVRVANSKDEFFSAELLFMV